MIIYLTKTKHSVLYRFLVTLVLLTFVLASPGISYAQSLNLPTPGTMLGVSPSFAPPLIKGLMIHPDNPLQFDFLIDPGNADFKGKTDQEKSDEYAKLVKYFLAALTVPEEELWVNLSPYEKDRIISDNFGKTEMGRDLLGQDYILKQLAASLMYPEKELGKQFWQKVYKEAQAKFGTIDIPVNTFNKVWIITDTASVYEKDNTVFLVDSHLKVMLEEDYVALSHQLSAISPLKAESRQLQAETNSLSSQVVREVIIPAIEKEVNEGKNFALLRQINNSLILATWYKTALKESLLGKVYVNRNKTDGVNQGDIEDNQKIYAQYLEAFKKGVYNYIKEEYDPVSEETVPRKYFSGGYATLGEDNPATLDRDESKLAGRIYPVSNPAMLSGALAEASDAVQVTVEFDEAASSNAAMLGSDRSKKITIAVLATAMVGIGGALALMSREEPEAPAAPSALLPPAIRKDFDREERMAQVKSLDNYWSRTPVAPPQDAVTYINILQQSLRDHPAPDSIVGPEELSSLEQKIRYYRSSEGQKLKVDQKIVEQMSGELYQANFRLKEITKFRAQLMSGKLDAEPFAVTSQALKQSIRLYSDALAFLAQLEGELPLPDGYKMIMPAQKVAVSARPTNQAMMTETILDAKDSIQASGGATYLAQLKADVSDNGLILVVRISGGSLPAENPVSHAILLGGEFERILPMLDGVPDKVVAALEANPRFVVLGEQSRARILRWARGLNRPEQDQITLKPIKERLQREMDEQETVKRRADIEARIQSFPVAEQKIWQAAFAQATSLEALRTLNRLTLFYVDLINPQFNWTVSETDRLTQSFDFSVEGMWDVVEVFIQAFMDKPANPDYEGRQDDFVEAMFSKYREAFNVQFVFTKEYLRRETATRPIDILSDLQENVRAISMVAGGYIRRSQSPLRIEILPYAKDSYGSIEEHLGAPMRVIQVTSNGLFTGKVVLAEMVMAWLSMHRDVVSSQDWLDITRVWGADGAINQFGEYIGINELARQSPNIFTSSDFYWVFGRSGSQNRRMYVRSKEGLPQRVVSAVAGMSIQIEEVFEYDDSACAAAVGACERVTKIHESPMSFVANIALWYAVHRKNVDATIQAVQKRYAAASSGNVAIPVSASEIRSLIAILERTMFKGDRAMLSQEAAQRQVADFISSSYGYHFNSTAKEDRRQAQPLAVELLQELHAKPLSYQIHDIAFTKGNITTEPEVDLSRLTPQQVVIFMQVVFARMMGYRQRPSLGDNRPMITAQVAELLTQKYPGLPEQNRGVIIKFLDDLGFTAPEEVESRIQQAALRMETNDVIANSTQAVNILREARGLLNSSSGQVSFDRAMMEASPKELRILQYPGIADWSNLSKKTDPGRGIIAHYQKNGFAASMDILKSGKFLVTTMHGAPVEQYDTVANHIYEKDYTGDHHPGLFVLDPNFQPGTTLEISLDHFIFFVFSEKDAPRLREEFPQYAGKIVSPREAFDRIIKENIRQKESPRFQFTNASQYYVLTPIKLTMDNGYSREVAIGWFPEDVFTNPDAPLEEQKLKKPVTVEMVRAQVLATQEKAWKRWEKDLLEKRRGDYYRVGLDHRINDWTVRVLGVNKVLVNGREAGMEEVINIGDEIEMLVQTPQISPEQAARYDEMLKSLATRGHQAGGEEVVKFEIELSKATRLDRAMMGSPEQMREEIAATEDGLKVEIAALDWLLTKLNFGDDPSKVGQELKARNYRLEIDLSEFDLLKQKAGAMVRAFETVLRVGSLISWLAQELNFIVEDGNDLKIVIRLSPVKSQGGSTGSQSLQVAGKLLDDIRSKLVTRRNQIRSVIQLMDLTRRERSLQKMLQATEKVLGGRMTADQQKVSEEMRGDLSSVQAQIQKLTDQLQTGGQATENFARAMMAESDASRIFTYLSNESKPVRVVDVLDAIFGPVDPQRKAVSRPGIKLIVDLIRAGIIGTSGDSKTLKIEIDEVHFLSKYRKNLADIQALLNRFMTTRRYTNQQLKYIRAKINRVMAGESATAIIAEVAAAKGGERVLSKAAQIVAFLIQNDDNERSWSVEEIALQVFGETLPDWLEDGDKRPNTEQIVYHLSVAGIIQNAGGPTQAVQDRTYFFDSTIAKSDWGNRYPTLIDALFPLIDFSKADAIKQGKLLNRYRAGNPDAVKEVEAALAKRKSARNAAMLTETQRRIAGVVRLGTGEDVPQAVFDETMKQLKFLKGQTVAMPGGLGKALILADLKNLVLYNQWLLGATIMELRKRYTLLWDGESLRPYIAEIILASIRGENDNVTLAEDPTGPMPAEEIALQKKSSNKMVSKFSPTDVPVEGLTSDQLSLELSRFAMDPNISGWTSNIYNTGGARKDFFILLPNIRGMDHVVQMAVEYAKREGRPDARSFLDAERGRFVLAFNQDGIDRGVPVFQRDAEEIRSDFLEFLKNIFRRFPLGGADNPREPLGNWIRGTLAKVESLKEVFQGEFVEGSPGQRLEVLLKEMAEKDVKSLPDDLLTQFVTDAAARVGQISFNPAMLATEMMGLDKNILPLINEPGIVRDALRKMGRFYYNKKLPVRDPDPALALSGDIAKLRVDRQYGAQTVMILAAILTGEKDNEIALAKVDRIYSSQRMPIYLYGNDMALAWMTVAALLTGESNGDRALEKAVRMYELQEMPVQQRTSTAFLSDKVAELKIDRQEDAKAIMVVAALLTKLTKENEAMARAAHFFNSKDMPQMSGFRSMGHSEPGNDTAKALMTVAAILTGEANADEAVKKAVQIYRQDLPIHATGGGVSDIDQLILLSEHDAMALMVMAAALTKEKDEKAAISALRDIYFHDEMPETLSAPVGRVGMMLAVILQIKKDAAMMSASTTIPAKDNKVGGIDLNPANLNLQIKRDGKGVPLPLPMQDIPNINVNGFIPVIINIQPIPNLPQLLGASALEKEQQPQLSSI